MSRLETDVCVVGAGLAGLTAARSLVASGYDTVVLEARPRVGGRLCSQVVGSQVVGSQVVGSQGVEDSVVLDVGGQWVGPGQDRINGLIAELGLRTFPTWTAGASLIGVGDSLRRSTGRVPPIGPHAVADLAQAQWRLDRAAKRIPLDRPWTARDATRLDGMTFETLICRTARTAAARDVLRTVADGVFAAGPTSFSALHALWYVNSGQGLDRLVGTRGGAQQDRVLGGAESIATALAAGLADRVRLDEPVRRIDHDPANPGGGVVVHSDRTVVAARAAVVAIPPTLAGRIDYRPGMPGDRDQLTQRMPAGAVIKCQVLYDRPFWRDDGLNGQVATTRPPVKVTFDNTPPGGAPGILLAFVEGAAAIGLARGGEAAVRREVLSCLERFFGAPAARPSEFVMKDWQAEEWTRGCYGAHFPTGVLTQFGPALRRRVGAIHWAGTETAQRWTGYMDGAVESGVRAARDVGAALG